MNILFARVLADNRNTVNEPSNSVESTAWQRVANHPITMAHIQQHRNPFLATKTQTDDSLLILVSNIKHTYAAQMDGSIKGNRFVSDCKMANVCLFSFTRCNFFPAAAVVHRCNKWFMILVTLLFTYGHCAAASIRYEWGLHYLSICKGFFYVTHQVKVVRNGVAQLLCRFFLNALSGPIGFNLCTSILYQFK